MYPLETLHVNLHVVRAKQLHVPLSMRKTNLCKMVTESSCKTFQLIDLKNIFLANQLEGFRTLLELVW